VTDANRRSRASKRARDGGIGAATAKRRVAERRGIHAEWLAAVYLMLKGYRILARRARTPRGEVDLIVRRGSAIVAVEVKARASLTEALNAVSPRQRQRIAAGLEIFLAGRPDLAGFDRRVDLIAMRPWRWPIHLLDVIRPGPPNRR